MRSDWPIFHGGAAQEVISVNKRAIRLVVANMPLSVFALFQRHLPPQLLVFGFSLLPFYHLQFTTFKQTKISTTFKISNKLTIRAVFCNVAGLTPIMILRSASGAEDVFYLCFQSKIYHCVLSLLVMKSVYILVKKIE